MNLVDIPPPPNVEPGTFYNLLNTMNLACICIVTIAIFVVIYSCVSWYFESKKEGTAGAPVQTTRAERRRFVEK